MATPNKQAHIVLVHGAWHGPWVWEPVLAELKQRGAAASTVALPSCGAKAPNIGLLEDARVVSAAVAKLDGPVLVCGHSYGGMVISSAEVDARVMKLVYLCAFMPQTGANLVSHFPDLPPYVLIREDGMVEFKTQMAREVFYGDCTPEAAAQATAQLVIHTAAAVTTPAPRAAWKQVPSLYVVCTEDRTIPADIQRKFATQATRTVELKASHSPMLSMPASVAELLVREASS